LCFLSFQYTHKQYLMADNNNNQRNDDVRHDDLRQKHEAGRDSTRTGSTGGDINAGEWKLSDEAHHTVENPQAGSSTGKGTNAGNGGDYTGNGGKDL
jgi:hypothetical protein